MLISEARELGSLVREWSPDAFPLVNVGSQSSDFRSRTQPWIDREIFGPLASRDRTVVHVDLADSVGVDLVADVTTPSGSRLIYEVGGRSVLCSNLLEHLAEPEQSLQRLCELVQPGCYLVASGPLHYPYHPDPIDNGFRPTSAEMARLLPDSFTIVDAFDVHCRRLIRYDLERAANLLRKPRRRHSSASSTSSSTGWTLQRLLGRFLWTFRRPAAYIVVARHNSDGPNQ